jgi:L-2,4-diaminobutyric acid acetyltransferase
VYTNNQTQIRLRRPEAEDGTDVWRLVKRAGNLDVNSVYSYLMLCEMFRDTCCVAVQDDRLCGFVSGFRKPADPDTLFIWQIAVDPLLHGNGIGGNLLRELLTREENHGIRYVEATISPNNLASRQLFIRTAEKLGTGCAISEHYNASMFPETHDAELLFRIGPIKMKVEEVNHERIETRG